MDFFLNGGFYYAADGDNDEDLLRGWLIEEYTAIAFFPDLTTTITG